MEGGGGASALPRPRLARWTGAVPGAGQLGPGWSVGPCDPVAEAAAAALLLTSDVTAVSRQLWRAAAGERATGGELTSMRSQLLASLTPPHHHPKETNRHERPFKISLNIGKTSPFELLQLR
jgi:hypothetical protein